MYKCSSRKNNPINSSSTRNTSSINGTSFTSFEKVHTHTGKHVDFQNNSIGLSKQIFCWGGWCISGSNQPSRKSAKSLIKNGKMNASRCTSIHSHWNWCQSHVRQPRFAIGHCHFAAQDAILEKPAYCPNVCTCQDSSKVSCLETEKLHAKM